SGNGTIVVQGVVRVVARAFEIINVFFDMRYVLINPRIRTV
ncbi:UNVERIFIED_CONTAM: ABC transporter permease, partial [Bifidobacterium breve]|nr:ABC transporter permease [Bifidobacterium breve]